MCDAKGENWEMEAICSVCMDLFDDPVILECSHNVCLNCAEQLFQFQATIEDLSALNKARSAPLCGIRCPECRQLTATPDGGVESLKRNLTLRNLVTRLKAEKKNKEVVLCGNCEEKAATCECQECGFEFCSDCRITQHQRGKYKNHTVVPLGQWSKSKPQSCPLHHKDLDLFCVGDDCAVCIYCLQLSGEHKSHEVISIKDAVDKARAQIEALMESAQRKAKDLRTAAEVSESAAIQIETMYDALCEEIEGFFAELMQAVQQRQQEILGEAAQLKAVHLCDVDKGCQKVQTVVQQVAELLSKYQTLLHDYTDMDLLKQKQRMLNRLRSMSEVHCPALCNMAENETSLPKWSFHADRALITTLKNAAYLQVNQSRQSAAATFSETGRPKNANEKIAWPLAPPTTSSDQTETIISLKIGDDKSARNRGSKEFSACDMGDEIKISLLGNLSQGTQDALPMLNVASLFEDTRARPEVSSKKRKQRSPSYPPSKAESAEHKKWELKI